MMAEQLSTFEQLKAQRIDILRLARKHGATRVRVFGSVARGEARPDSDIDFLVAFQTDTSIWEVIGLWQALAEMLGRDISLVTEASLDGEFRQQVLKDAIPL